eukprot:jgi/Mesvir1/196/Mv25422-RA.1
MDVTFDKPVTGFGSGDIYVNNGTVSSVTGTGASYQFAVTPTTPYSQTTVRVVDGTTVGEFGVTNAESNTVAFTYSPPPTVTLATSAGATPSTSPVGVTATFSRSVTGFALGDIIVTNGAASNLVQVNAAFYTFDVSGTSNTLTTVSVGSNAATDSVSGNGNSASNSLTFTYTPGYNPATDPNLFAWYDPSDSATVFSDTTGTTHQNTTGGNVMRVNDKGPNGYHVTQATSSKCPTLDTTELNSKQSLRFINSRSGLLESVNNFWNMIGASASVFIVANS